MSQGILNLHLIILFESVWITRSISLFPNVLSRCAYRLRWSIDHLWREGFQTFRASFYNSTKYTKYQNKVLISSLPQFFKNCPLVHRNLFQSHICLRPKKVVGLRRGGGHGGMTLCKGSFFGKWSGFLPKNVDSGKSWPWIPWFGACFWINWGNWIRK